MLWFASSILLTTALIGLWRTGGVATRIAISVLNLLIALANVLLAVSFLVQGVGFNLTFFGNADWETLALASVTLRQVLAFVAAQCARPVSANAGGGRRCGAVPRAWMARSA